MKMSTAAAAAVLLLASCAAPRETKLAPSDAGRRIAAAAADASRGDYVSLKSAFAAYGDLYAVKALRARVASAYFRTALLLDLRAKDLGIASPAPMNRAYAVWKETPGLAGLKSYLVHVAEVPLTGGFAQLMIDQELLPGLKPAPGEMKSLQESLAKSAQTDETAAVVLFTHRSRYGRFGAGDENPAPIAARFPASPSLRYLAALYPEEDTEKLRGFLDENPGFHEAAFHLGKATIAGGQLLTAEKLLLGATGAIPESPQIPLILGSLYFATEEFERSLEFFDRALALSPESRDGLLGRALALNYLGRPAESLAVCERMIGLGFYLIGEANYWKARDLQDLKRNEEALAAADEAKSRLGNAEVNALAGTIGLDLGLWDRAEADFRAALGFDAGHVDALIGMGRVSGHRGKWMESGDFFATAHQKLVKAVDGLRQKIADIEKAAMPADRKARMKARKLGQIEIALDAGATAALHAAASYESAGDPAVAAEWAARAADRPSVKPQADEMLKRLRK